MSSPLGYLWKQEQATVSGYFVIAVQQDRKGSDLRNSRRGSQVSYLPQLGKADRPLASMIGLMVDLVPYRRADAVIDL